MAGGAGTGGSPVRRTRGVILLAGAALVAGACGAERTEEAPPVRTEEVAQTMSIRISAPADGAEVGPDSVRFSIAAQGVEIVPAGTEGEGTGHHHLLFNVDAPPPGSPIPSTEGYVHLGQAQTEYAASLAPGEYRVIALLGDGTHFPHDPPIADTITITVR